MAGTVDLDTLKQRLTRLGVNLASLGPSHAGPTTGHAPKVNSLESQTALKASSNEATRANNKEVAELLERIGHVEQGLRAADNMASAAAACLGAHAAAAGSGPEPRKAKSPGPTRPRKVTASRPAKPVARAAHAPSAGMAIGGRAVAVSNALRASVAPGAPKGAVGPSHELLKGVPAHTPLSTVLHQYKEAEVVWAHEKAQLRREAVEQRKRANKLDADLRRLTRITDHKTLDVKSLRSALKNRDAQLDAALERIKELEGLLKRTQEEGSVKACALAAERDDCKALLLATLQRLEAVDDVVHRADVSSAMMQDKMKALEDERLRALEAAARARAEVAELTESRRKLQWQSKLLEKMSEVQLKHNKRKSEAIKKLLGTDQAAGSEAQDSRSLGSTDVDTAAAAAGSGRAFNDLLNEASFESAALHDMMQRAGLLGRPTVG